MGVPAVRRQVVEEAVDDLRRDDVPDVLRLAVPEALEGDAEALPATLKTGPPLLPGLMAASIWMTSSRPGLCWYV